MPARSGASVGHRLNTAAGIFVLVGAIVLAFYFARRVGSIKIPNLSRIFGSAGSGNAAPLGGGLFGPATNPAAAVSGPSSAPTTSAKGTYTAPSPAVDPAAIRSMVTGPLPPLGSPFRVNPATLSPLAQLYATETNPFRIPQPALFEIAGASSAAAARAAGHEPFSAPGN